MPNALDQYFKLSENGTNIRTEIMAGVTTFLTMAYIIAVNPLILSEANLPFEGVLLATVLVCALSSIFMGLYANLPFGLAPGMGINAFFTYTLVLTMGDCSGCGFHFGHNILHSYYNKSACAHC
jgi:AGZA family xanthine/uracil permease-like MFS transporter